MKVKKVCALCNQEVTYNVVEPFACWRCVEYFSQHPDRAVVVHSKVVDDVKKRLLESMFPAEPEEEINGDTIRANMVRERHHNPLKPKGKL